ncbi:hypothetical protein B0T21DRAFT_288148 [Apiosordaria backusii]|uniref:Uncharacterized protein n=1 Tax=Apiosordaria backusii TaxID=314023 RepID=A0AA40BKW4_9PEZI|nr:hypothetical protein B0T21DRAFT_288148 [Apiosordaria backusii]
MPRQLPWKVKKDEKPQAEISPSPKSTTTCSPAPPHRPSKVSTPTPHRELSGDRDTNLSARLMMEGIDKDDKYRMVEDEFLAVAGGFTRHLHAAEYQRLKGLAKSQNAETISNISRPVTGEMTDMVKRHHAALNIASKQRKEISKLKKRTAAYAMTDTDDEEPPPRKQPGQSSLQGLMDSPRKRAVPLTSFSSIIRGSSFREPSPSRGPGSAPGLRREESTFSVSFIKREPTPDSDDLDGHTPWPVRRASTQPLIKRELSTTEEPTLPALPAARPRVRFGTATNEPSRTTSRPPERSQPQVPQVMRNNDTAPKQHEDEDEDDNDFLSRIRARRVEQKRRRDARLQKQQSGIKSESQEAALDEIPFI